MKVRVTFRSEAYINGKDWDEIKEKWQDLNLYSEDFIKKANGGFVELTSVEDADTFEDFDEKSQQSYASILDS